MKIYIQTNSRQYLASKVSAYSFFRFGYQPILMNLDDIGILRSIIGRKYLRNGKLTKYKNDLQSFTLLRFYAPELNNYKESSFRDVLKRSFDMSNVSKLKKKIYKKN